MAAVQTNNLPPRLRETGLFCCWRYENRQDKPTKVPYNPRTGGGAQSTNPDTFAPLAVAMAAVEREGYTGVGVGLFGHLGAIDIDHCIDDNGELSSLAFDVMDTMQAYTEYSPSGHGLRILFTVPESFRYDKVRYYTNNQKAGLEVYIAGATNKYVTVTGNALTPGLDLEERGEQLAAVLEKHMVRPQRPTPATAPSGGAADLDDLALIERAKQGRNGAAFSLLWDGNTTGYNSSSEADMALCNALAWWTNKDPQRVDKLFRQSGLMREKWDRQQSGSTYGAITIQNAVATCRGGYDPAPYRQGHELTWSAPIRKAADTETPATVKPPDYSDAGNATVFSLVYDGEMLFVDALGWLWWNGKKWEQDDHKATARAMDLSAMMLKEAVTKHSEALMLQADAKARFAETGEDEDKESVKAADSAVAKSKAYLNHAKQTRNAARIRNMLDLAKPFFVVKADKLDANPFDFNTPAGIVDLCSGSVRPHDPAAYCSQIAAADPGVGGEQMWARFLDTITQGNGSIKGFLQLVAGMALFGRVYHEGIILAYGGGRNGKSTFFNALGAALGDYSGNIDITVLTTDKQNNGAALATLRGKRLVTAGELEEGKRLSVSTVKKVASTDLISIERKYHDPETITPSHSLVLFTNHLPRVGSTDGGTWRRLLVVPFNATIPTHDSVANFGEVLAREAGPAILKWAIEGAVNFARNGFKLDVPDVVAEATEAYREREDWLNNFINERCIREPNARVRAGELYAEYQAWAQESGDYVRRLTDFAAGMEAAGFRNVRPQNKSTWIGLKLDLEAKFGGAFSAAN